MAKMFEVKIKKAKVCESVKAFVSLCVEDTRDEMVQMISRALLEEVTDSSYYTISLSIVSWSLTQNGHNIALWKIPDSIVALTRSY